MTSSSSNCCSGPSPCCGGGATGGAAGSKKGGSSPAVNNSCCGGKGCSDGSETTNENSCCSPKSNGATAVKKPSAYCDVGGNCSEAKSCCNGGQGSSKTTQQNSCCGNDAIGDDCCSSRHAPLTQNPWEDATGAHCNTSSHVSVDECRGSICAIKHVSSGIDSSEKIYKPCCNSKDTGTGSPCIPTHTCLAVMRPDNSAVDVFDTRGNSKTFRIKNKRKDMSERKLCFSTHGAGEDIDGMLTPCFNRDGEHEEPDEGCPCGEDEAHLHAHFYDPEVCGVVDNAGCTKLMGGAAAARKKATNWRFLSQLTLELDDDEEDGAYSMPISESMPKECNSGALRNHLSERGLKLEQWLHWRNEGRSNQTCNENNYCGDSCESHRMYPVHHEDHTDFLIHNETTGELHMEHPCASCGGNDIHGRFHLEHTRSWMADGSGKGGSARARINLHFFELHDEPFHLLDVLSGLFELESSRVAAATRPVSAGVEERRVGRSQFFVAGICCATEIPQVEAILRPLDGVVEISVNPTTKTVYVDHDVDIISADRIANALSDLGAVVKKDAAVAMDQMAGIPTDAFVESRFDLTNVLEDTKEADRGKVAEVIQGCLVQKFSDQVKNVTVNEAEKILVVEHNPYYLTATGITEALAGHMYDVSISVDGAADGMWALSLMKEDSHDTIGYESSSVRWTVVVSGVLWIISMFSLIGGNWEYLKYVALLSVAFGLPPIAVKAFRTLRRFHFDVNCMMLFAAVGALPLEEYTESAAIVFLFGISEALESRATSRARNALSAIVSLRPERANVINPVTKDIVVLPASAVPVGTLVSVRSGDKIPCDGVVQEGKSTIDESTLTGESRPVTKSAGMQVSGGTINTGNTQLVIKTTATSSNSAVARLIRLVEEAQSNRSDTEKLVDSFAKIYTPIVVLAALCMCTIPWAFGTEVGQYWAKNGLITIVIACPCALIISTPVVYVAGLAAVAQKGVIVKGGQYLEGLGRVKSIAFDKTGTLSEGVFQLLHVNVIGQSHERKEVLVYLALMEAPASHPLSDAIVKGVANEKVDIPKRIQVKDHTLLPGEGITGVIDGKKVYVGNKKLFERLDLYDILPVDAKATAEEWAQSGATIGFISIEGDGMIGSYCVSDKIRDETKNVLHALKKMGIDITMLTGDQRAAAIGIGAQVGLKEDDIKSELLPEDKLAEISQMVKENEMNKSCWNARRTVMMVGDGVNDAPALALADVSVAMGEGAALAMDTADCTLLDCNLNKLLYILRMGRRATRTIIENVVFSLVVKALVMGFMFVGKATLWAAIASDVGAMLIVTINGMKLLPSSRKVRQNDLAVQESAKELTSV